MSYANHLMPLAEHPELSKIVPDYVDPLALDMRRLGRLTALGCLDPEVAFAIENGEGSSYDTKIIGRVGNTALGGATRVRSAQLSNSGLTANEEHSDTANPRLTITINTTAIQEQVQQKGNARDGNAWAKPINHAITSELTKRAWERLVTPKSLGDITISALTLGQTGLAGFVLAYGGFDPDYIARTSGVWAAWGGAWIAMKRNSTPHNRRRYTLLPGVAIDRAIAVSTLSTLRLIRPLN